MAQTLVFNDIDVELTIDTSTGTNDLLVTGVEGQKIVTAVRNLKQHIPTLKKVSWDIPGGGIVGRVGVLTKEGVPVNSRIQRQLYLNFSNLTLPSPNYYYTFSNGSWTELELRFVDEVKDAMLSFNVTHALTGVVGQSAPVPFGGHPSLNDQLIAYYTMDDTAGTRMDSLLENNLDSSGAAIPTMAGKIGLAINPSGTIGHYLAKAGDLINPVTTITFSTWFNPISPDSVFSSALINAMGVGSVDWSVNYIPASNKLYAILYNTLLGSTDVISTAAVPNDAWSMVTVVVDVVAKTIEIRINAGAADVSPALVGTVKTTNYEMRIGYPGPFQLIGMDETGLWNRRLTASEITALNNGGAGLSY